MQKNVIRAVVVVFFLAALPAIAAPAKRSSLRQVPAIARFLVWLHSRLGPPLPAPAPQPETETDSTTRAAQPR